MANFDFFLFVCLFVFKNIFQSKCFEAIYPSFLNFEQKICLKIYNNKIMLECVFGCAAVM